MLQEQIAEPWGTLEWHVNNSGLKQFQRALDRVQNSLKPLQAAVAKAESKLNGVGKAALTDYISTHLENNFARHHREEMQIYRQTQIGAAEGRK